MGAEVASKAIQPIIFVFLARLLLPEDFGVMTAALMVVSFSQVFWEAGMGKALIQRQTEIEEAANAAFWINCVLGSVVAVILFVSADIVARLIFQDERVVRVLQVMSLQVLLGALASVHTALLQKDMKFNRLFWVRFATVSLPGLVSIPLAWNGMGYWALVAGTLFGQAIQVVTLWLTCEWKPRFVFNSAVAHDLLRFGVWVWLSGLLVWLYVWADSLVVGIYMGSRDLGLYRTGNQFVIFFYSLIFVPILPVLYSHFSAIQNDRKRLNKALNKLMRLIAFIAIPMAIILFVTAEPLMATLFGDEWSGIGFVVSVMALTHGYAWIVGASGEIYRAVEKPNYETLAMLIGFAVYLPLYLIAIQFGLAEFIWTRFILVAWGICLNLYFLRRSGMESIWDSVFFSVKVSLATAPLLIPSMFITPFYNESSTLIWLFSLAVVSGLVIASLRVIARQEIRFLAGIMGTHKEQ